MPIWDYQCPICGTIKEDQAEAPLCEHCDQEGQPVVMVKRPAAPNFTIRGYSAKSGYSRKD